jgi:hypothetical protein
LLYANVILEITGYQHITELKVFECPALTLCLHLPKYVSSPLTSHIMVLAAISKYIFVLFFWGREISMAFGSNLMATLMTQAFFPCLEFYFLGLNLTIFWLLPSYVFIQTNMYIVYHCIKKFSLEDYA